MRTTTDLPPPVRRRVQELAEQRGQSVSAVVAKLTARGLASLQEPVEIAVDPVSGLPALRIGRTVTSADVAAILDEE